MPKVTDQHASKDSKPDTLLSRAAQHNSSIDGKQSVLGTDIGEQELKDGCDSQRRFHYEGWKRNSAQKELFGIRHGEIGPTEGQDRLDVEEVDSVRKGDFMQERLIGGHSDLFLLNVKSCPKGESSKSTNIDKMRRVSKGDLSSLLKSR